MSIKYYPLNRIRPLTTFIGHLQVQFIRSTYETQTEEQIAFNLENGYLHQAVKGPFDQYYILGPCHGIAALNKDFGKKIPLKVLRDYSNMDEDEFFIKLINKFDIYDKTRKGHLINFEDLPEDFSDLKDDPYQSFMYYLERKETIPAYAEFNHLLEDALHLRDRLPGLKPKSLEEFSPISTKAADILAEEMIHLDIKHLRPTQFSLGLLEIDVKTRYLEQMSDELFQAYMERNLFWGVKAPKGQIYLIDGHHKVRSLLNLGLKSLPITIVADLSHLSEKEFWDYMTDQHWIYLKDKNGESLSYRDLPDSFKQLKDDPFRSLAWFIRKNKVYKKDGKPFQEFEWANFLRKNLANIKLETLGDIKAQSQNILEIVYSEQALKLRGHQGRDNQIKRLETDIY